MISKSDLIMLADAIRCLDVDEHIRRKVALGVGNACRMSNPRFLWHVWHQACGTENPKGWENA
jgi:hypothetical protein